MLVVWIIAVLVAIQGGSVPMQANVEECTRPSCFLILQELDSEFSKTIGRGSCVACENGTETTIHNFQELTLGYHRCFRTNGKPFAIIKMCKLRQMKICHNVSEGIGVVKYRFSRSDENSSS